MVSIKKITLEIPFKENFELTVSGMEFHFWWDRVEDGMFRSSGVGPYMYDPFYNHLLQTDKQSLKKTTGPTR
jgi:hypothetical protein